jgi:hypothetical protein
MVSATIREDPHDGAHTVFDVDLAAEQAGRALLERTRPCSRNPALTGNGSAHKLTPS